MDERTYEEKARENKEPMQYKIYKGMGGKLGAMRVKLKKAYTSIETRKQEGCIFLEMAPAIGKNLYDWQNGKIVMALGIVDIPKIILFLRNPQHPSFKEDDGSFKCKLYHDKGAGTADKGRNTKTLDLFKSDRTTNFMLSLSHKENDTRKNASVTLSPDEAIALGTLFQQAIPLILSWV